MVSLSPSVPFGYCQCGCGKKTPIASATNSRQHAIKGQPTRFMHGHHLRPANICAIPNCTRERYKLGICQMHVRRFDMHGSYDLPARPSVQERFWSKVDKESSPHGCWLWTASTSGGGYGQFPYPRGRNNHAHRLAWKWLVGPVADNIEVCHNCPGGDNRACVNPAHMFLGTGKDNMQDASRKGAFIGRPTHTYRGVDHPQAIVTEAQVREIRARRAAGGTTLQGLATEYGFKHLQSIADIVNRKTWAHIP